jgi:D-alanyl-D-alanine carboxypeptidase
MRGYDLGTMELSAGESLSVAEALERMITISDNTSAVMLGSRVGGGRVNANIAALGMDTTHYSLERMTTSAEDMLRLLDVLAHGKAVSATASADMLHLMLRQRVNDRLPRLLPDDVQVAHKTGNLPGTVNDVGIVYGPSTTLVVAVLISDSTDEAAAAAAIARVAQVTYAYFDDQPEAAGRPTIPRAPARAIPPVWRAPRPTPTPTVEPTELPTAVPVQPTAEPTAVSTPTRPATAVPTVVRQQLAATVTAAPTRGPATPTAAPPQPTRTLTRPAAATATPTPRR